MYFHFSVCPIFWVADTLPWTLLCLCFMLTSYCTVHFLSGKVGSAGLVPFKVERLSKRANFYKRLSSSGWLSLGDASNPLYQCLNPRSHEKQHIPKKNIFMGFVWHTITWFLRVIILTENTDKVFPHYLLIF